MGRMYGHSSVPTVAAADVPVDAPLIDVREADEWAMAHVDGSAHVPMGDLPARLDELPRDRTVFVLCAVGGRSAHVTAWLVAQGFDAANVDGGLAAWIRAGRPVVDGAGSTVKF
jgi:rhodanese-related sulfurtransferase